jgi:hypothetical protein
MPEPREYTYNVATLANLTGLTINAIHQHHSRGLFKPDDLKSVVLYLAQFGSLKLRQDMVLAATTNQMMVASRNREAKKRTTKKQASRK